MISYKRFADIDINDIFFDSLKQDYIEFTQWFQKKTQEGEMAYVFESNGIQGFLYLKIENEEITDTKPTLPKKNRIKVGTFKINPHGTRLGERFLKKIFDYAVIKDIDEIYVTVFDKHEGLMNLFKRFGFCSYGTKVTKNGTENVLVKNIKAIKESVSKSYPIIKITETNKFVLAIYPEFHTRLFPDSILNNESYDLIEDISHTNSIYKIYICYMDLSPLRLGDNILIYRTSDGKGSAAYRSVVTSVCVVEEIKTRTDFANIDEYLHFCKDYSVFTEAELRSFYAKRTANFFVLKMTYNAALKKRVIRKQLIEDLGISPSIYWGFFKLSEGQFNRILELGEIDAGIIIN